jgi:hypothetical protein
LTDPELGDYLSAHFVCAFQKISSFKIVNGRKVGGNVASYFLTADGRVMHCVVGPVSAEFLLAEAQWAVETRSKALEQARGLNTALATNFRKAHADRLKQEHDYDFDFRRSKENVSLAASMAVAFDKSGKATRLNRQGRTHVILAAHPLTPIDQIYGVIFERVLHQKISNLPVLEIDNPFGGKGRRVAAVVAH